MIRQDITATVRRRLTSPAEPGASAIFVLATICVYVLCSIFFGRLFARDGDSLLVGPFDGRTIAFATCSWLATVLWTIYGLRRWLRTSLTEIGFGRIERGSIFYALGGALAMYVGAMLATVGQWYAFGLVAHPWPQTLLRSTSGPFLATFIAIGTLLGPFVEETVVRGVLFGSLERRYGFWIAAIVSSAVFAAYHFQLGAVFPIFVDGMILTTLYHRTKSLWVPYATHALYNYAAFAAIIAR